MYYSLSFITIIIIIIIIVIIIIIIKGTWFVCRLSGWWTTKADSEILLYFYRCVHMVREMFEAIPHLTENRNVGLKRLKRVELGTTPSNSK